MGLARPRSLPDRVAGCPCWSPCLASRRRSTPDDRRRLAHRSARLCPSVEPPRPTETNLPSRTPLDYAAAVGNSFGLNGQYRWTLRTGETRGDVDVTAGCEVISRDTALGRDDGD